MKFKITVVVLGTAILLEFAVVTASFGAPVRDLPRQATERALSEAIRKLKTLNDDEISREAPPAITAPEAASAASSAAEPTAAVAVVPTASTLAAPRPEQTPAPVIQPDVEDVVTINKTAKDKAGSKPDSLIAAQKRYHVLKKAASARKEKPSEQDIRDALERRRMMLARAALGFRGTPYVWGGSTHRAFDCSGFTQYLYKKQYGIDLPHKARMQFQMGKPVSIDELKVGDLVFFNTKGPLTHVGMYIGNGKFIHAANSRRGVRVDKLTSGYYRGVYAGARSYR